MRIQLISYLLVLILIFNLFSTFLGLTAYQASLLVHSFGLLTKYLLLDLVPFGLSLLIVRIE
jgi:hypothetical protein